jgi:tRNA(Ile)-lysidine synthase
LAVNIVDVLKSALAEYCQGLFVSKVRDSEYSGPIQELCVAFSGGLDSTVLLDTVNQVCKEANIPLSAFHINHGISANANAWQRHCQQECSKRNIPFHTQAISIKKSAQQSLEAEARTARYSILDNYAQMTKVVLLGQHQDDQAETFLLQLKRGAGVQGLSSMPVMHTKASGTVYLRPFLDVSRANLLDYARQNNLQWIEDESNRDNSYDRNFLRNQIFPSLQARWPAINKTISRSALNCAQSYEVITEYMQLIGNEILDPKKAIVSSLLQKHSAPTQQSFLRYWLAKYYQLSPSSAQLLDIAALIQSASANSRYIALGGLAIERFKDKLHVIDLPENLHTEKNRQAINIDWSETTVIALNKGLALHLVDGALGNDNTIDADTNQQTFFLPKHGVECVFSGSNLGFKDSVKRPTKKLKALYQEWGISHLQRLNVPVFVKDNEVLCVGVSPMRISVIKSSCVKDTIKVKLVKSN